MLQVSLKTFPNVRERIGIIILRKLATLYELQTIYSIDDIMDLFEIIQISDYNENQIYRSQRNKK